MLSLDHVVRLFLPNGLTLLIQRHAAAPVVAVVTHVRTGYFDEPDEWVGIAHVLEHMYFKGTARRGPGEIARETQAVGGYINAGTIYDKTVYYTVLPSTDGGLARALDVQADALMHAALDGAELRRELEVIIQEAKRKLDTPSAVTTESLYRLLFTTHRMRRWRIGTEDGLRRLTAQDLTAFYRTRYTPDRTIVALVGDLEVDRAERLARETFESWSRPAAPVAGSPVEPEERHALIETRSGDVERPMAALGWRTVGTLHPDAAALDVAADVLGRGRGSRLYRALRLPGLASAAHAEHYTPTEVGVFQLAVEAAPEPFDDAVQAAVEEVRRLRDTAPAPEELDRVRALDATQWARRLETTDGRAAALCDAEALGNYRLLEDLIHRTERVTAVAVRDAAERYLTERALCAVSYLPRGAATRHERRWPPPAGVPSLMSPVSPGEIPRVPTGAARFRETRHAGDIVHRAYPAVDVVAWRKAGAGSVTLMLHFPGTPLIAGIEAAGWPALAARATLRGAGRLGAEDLAQRAERLGGALGTSAGPDGIGWGITVRRGAAPAAAALLRLVAAEPSFAENAVRVEARLQASDARHLRDDMFRHPMEMAVRQAFPDDPYGLPSLGDPDRIEETAASDLRRWHEAAVARRPVLVVAGDFDPEDLDGAATASGPWPVTGLPPEPGAPVWAAGRGSEPRDKRQTAIAMAFPAAPFRSPERHAAWVACAVLSGLAGRLFDEVREKRSLAYTVLAIPWLRRRAGAVLCYVATSPDRATEARDAMMAELERLVREPPTGAELDRARQYTAGSVQVRKQSAATVAGELLEAWVTGTLAEVADTPAALRAVRTDDVVRFAERAFRRESRAEYEITASG